MIDFLNGLLLLLVALLAALDFPGEALELTANVMHWLSHLFAIVS